MPTYADPDAQNQLRRQTAAEMNMLVSGMIDGKTTYVSPSQIMQPTVSLDGSMYCALSGENLAIGVCGFGKTAALALADYDRNFVHQSAPEPRT